MHDDYPTILSAHDYSRLQLLLSTMIGARSATAALVRCKLGSATVMPPSDIGEDVVTSGCKVQFKVDGVRLDERELLWSPHDQIDGSALSLMQPRGLALLGLSVGQWVSYQTDSRRTRTLLVTGISAGHRRVSVKEKVVGLGISQTPDRLAVLAQAASASTRS